VQQTLILLKPERGLQRRLVGPITNALSRGKGPLRASRGSNLLNAPAGVGGEALWPVHKGKPFVRSLLKLPDEWPDGGDGVGKAPPKRVAVCLEPDGP